MSTEDLKCQDFPKMDPKFISDNMDEIAKQSGMSTKCKKAASQMANDISDSSFDQFSFSMSASVMGGMVGSSNATGEGVSNSDYYETTTGSQQSSEGCGQVIVQAAETFRATNNMQCTLTDNSEIVSGKAGAKATVEIRQKESKAEELAYRSLQEVQLLAMSKISDAILNPDVDPERLKFAREALDSQVEQARLAAAKISDSSGNLTIKNSDIGARAQADVRVIKKSSKAVSEEITSDYKTIAQATAENEVREATGVGTLPYNARKMISNKVQDVNNNINTSIEKAMDEVSVDTTVEGKVVITSSKSILIENSTIKADAILTQMVEAIKDSATALGRKFATEIITDLSTMDSTEIESEGMEEFMKTAMQSREKTMKAKADVITAFGIDIPNGGMYASVGKLVVACVAGYALYKLFASGKVKVPKRMRPVVPRPPAPPMGLPPMGMPPRMALPPPMRPVRP